MFKPPALERKVAFVPIVKATLADLRELADAGKCVTTYLHGYVVASKRMAETLKTSMPDEMAGFVDGADAVVDTVVLIHQLAVNKGAAEMFAKLEALVEEGERSGRLHIAYGVAASAPVAEA